MSKPSISKEKDSSPKPRTLGDLMAMSLAELVREGGA